MKPRPYWAGNRPDRNIVAIAMLFLTGYTLGRQSGRPWRVGLSMVALGLGLVAVAMALGG